MLLTVEALAKRKELKRKKTDYDLHAYLNKGITRSIKTHKRLVSF
jgi:hypothetical protein